MYPYMYLNLDIIDKYDVKTHEIQMHKYKYRYIRIYIKI